MLIPVRIDVSYREDYPVTLALIGLNLLAFIPVISSILTPCCQPDISLFTNYGLVPSSPELSTFVTHMFIHGGIFYLVFNMLFFWLFGKVVESIFGHWRFLLFYFGGGITAALTHILICHLTGMGKEIPMIGASGAIAAVLGIFLIRYWFVKIELRWFFFYFFFFRIYTFHVKAWIFLLGLWFAPQLIFGLLFLGGFSSVAYWAHIGGFLFGAILGLQMNLLKEAKAEILYLKGQNASGSKDEIAFLHLKQSIETSPKNIQPRLELAQSYMRVQKYDEAVKEYVKAFLVLYNQGQIEEALGIYEIAFKLKLDELILSDDMEFKVGVQCIKYANYELGYLIFQKLCRLCPNHLKMEQILAKLIDLCSNKLGQYREGYEYFQELKSRYPQSRYIKIFEWEMNKIENQLSLPPQKIPS